MVICCVFAFIGNLRGFNMTAPALQQFFPQATRHSLLGPPPVGVSLKPTRMGFPNLPFQRQNRTFRKVGLEFPTVQELCALFAFAAADCIVGGEQKRKDKSLTMKTICTMLLTQKCRNQSIPKVFVVHIYIYVAKVSCHFLPKRGNSS